MSALAAILTLLPLALAPALGLGAGAQLQQPLAVAIVSGLIVAVPLVLVAMPAWYALLGGARPAR
jgi:multidrug efflux pump subunit AcrB